MGLLRRSGGGPLLAFAVILAFASSVVAADHEFRYKRADANSVEVMGEFNGWKSVPMKKGGDDVWTAAVPLPAGPQGYKFLVNGTEWVFDPDNPARKTVDGVENSSVDRSANAAVASSPSPPANATPPATISKDAALAPAALSPTPGELLVIEVPISEKRRAQAVKEGNANLKHVRIGLSVPPGFDPRTSWPVLVVCNTETYSNIDSLRQFQHAANDVGWVGLGADAVEAEATKEGSWRYVSFGAAFDYLMATWPAMKDWPVASGGMSGGGKNGAFLAADLAREHHRVIGMLMMGCNQDMATVAYRRSAPPSFLNAAVFLSSGKNDTIATPAAHEMVKNSLRATGFSKVRLESFDGAHDINQPHITEALPWFIAQQTAAKGTSTPTNSDFDKFFRKKP